MSDAHEEIPVKQMPKTLEWKVTNSEKIRFWIGCAKCNRTLYAWEGIKYFYCNHCNRQASDKDAKKIRFILQMSSL